MAITAARPPTANGSTTVAINADPLLQPFRLGGLTLRNRLVSTSHEPAYAEDSKPKLRYQLYHEEKAKGGIALTMIGGSATASIDSPSTFGQLYLGDDSIVPYLKQLADRVHAHGAAVMCQVTHMGRRTKWDKGDWLPVIAPSPLREPAHRSFPKEMEPHDLRRVIKSFGAAAKRCQDGGLDGIEISAHAGQLLEQFFSPRMNQRHDGYGGSLDNRMRLTLEVLEVVRHQVGDDFVVGVRMTASERADDGLTEADAIAIGQRLAGTGMVDLVSLTVGGATTYTELAEKIQPLGTPLGPYLETVGRFREKVDLPILHAGRIADLATARHALRGGYVDLVGMVRAHMADPHIISKLEAGEEDRIRPCVGASYCINRIYVGLDALCIHNPATGHETLIPQISPSAPQARRVVVLGGGPGGLEAARACAERGHQVLLIEAAGQLGGQIRLAARANERQQELLGIVDWLESEVRRLGVTVRLNSYAEADEVRAQQPDVVIIATGGMPATPKLSAGAHLTTSTWDVLSGDAVAKPRALVFDDHGGDQALSTAEKLAASGSRVEIVSPDREVGFEIKGTLYPTYMRSFYNLGVVMTPNYRLQEVGKEGADLVAVLVNEYTGTRVERRVDQVVVEHGTLPVDDVYMALRDGSSNLGELNLDAYAAVTVQDVVNNPDGQFQLFRIGDAVASRNIYAAIHDARRIALSV